MSEVEQNHQELTQVANTTTKPVQNPKEATEKSDFGVSLTVLGGDTCQVIDFLGNIANANSNVAPNTDLVGSTAENIAPDHPQPIPENSTQPQASRKPQNAGLVPDSKQNKEPRNRQNERATFLKPVYTSCLQVLRNKKILPRLSQEVRKKLTTPQKSSFSEERIKELTSEPCVSAWLFSEAGIKRIYHRHRKRRAGKETHQEIQVNFTRFYDQLTRKSCVEEDLLQENAKAAKEKLRLVLQEPANKTAESIAKVIPRTDDLKAALKPFEDSKVRRFNGRGSSKPTGATNPKVRIKLGRPLIPEIFEHWSKAAAGLPEIEEHSNLQEPPNGTRSSEKTKLAQEADANKPAQLMTEVTERSDELKEAEAINKKNATFVYSKVVSKPEDSVILADPAPPAKPPKKKGSVKARPPVIAKVLDKSSALAESDIPPDSTQSGEPADPGPSECTLSRIPSHSCICEYLALQPNYSRDSEYGSRDRVDDNCRCRNHRDDHSNLGKRTPIRDDLVDLRSEAQSPQHQSQEQQSEHSIVFDETADPETGTARQLLSSMAPSFIKAESDDQPALVPVVLQGFALSWYKNS